MKKTIYYKRFVNSLTNNDQGEYAQMSLNQQKDWYICWLESSFNDGVQAKIKLEKLLKKVDALLKAVDQSTTDMWHDDLECSSQVVLLDDDTVGEFDDDFNYTENSPLPDIIEIKYPGIRNELEELKKYIEYYENINS